MQIFFTVYFFMLGALFASFFNVVGIRVYNGVSIMTRSHCPRCNHQLRWIDIIPIFGYLINGGKCHFCRQPIHIKYFFIEVFGGTFLALAFWFQGFSILFLYSFLLLCMVMTVTVCYYEYSKMLNGAIYIFGILALIISIYFDLTLHNGILYLSFMGAGILALLAYFSRFINPNNKKYFLISIAIGFAIGVRGIPLFLVVFGLGMLIKLGLKKLPTLYIMSFSAMVSFIFTSGLYELFIKILSE